MKRTAKTLDHFEQAHGQPKLKRMERELAAEHAKVEALAGIQNRVKVEKRASCKLKFGVIGDTHIGSLYARLNHLQGFADYARDCGCESVFHCGDVLDGHRIYKGQEFELRDLGLEAQLDRLAKDCSNVGKVRFITGNHDGSFKSAAGVPVGKLVQQACPDWEFLGEEQATIKWDTPTGPFSLKLLHPGGGAAYSLSYRPQKIVESITGGEKPDMLAIGHYHKAEIIPSYRNVCVIQSGTFQAQTPFMARGGLAAHLGGWIVEVTVGNGHNIIKAEFVAFYV